MLAGSAWKYTADDEGHIYRIQVNNVPDNTVRDYVEEKLSDWSTSGEGWNNNGQILFFVKKFSDTDKWEEWVKSFKHFNLKILDREGKAKKQIVAEVNIIPDKSISKRVCSKCKKPGHNSATCRDFHRKEVAPQIITPATIVEEKGKNTCSICKQKGHNARRCQLKNK